MTRAKYKDLGKRTVEFYGHGIKNLQDIEIKGRLIVIEGPDASGRSTQIQEITTRLEADGHAVLNTGLKRSELVGRGILEAKRDYNLGRKTLALYYAADFADQFEYKIIPALQAGYIVLADRYIYTLIARNLVRGLDRTWCHNLYGFAIKPDIVFYLDVEPSVLIHRVFQKNSTLDHYESGADIGLSEDMYESFLIYQKRISQEFHAMQKKYGLIPINGNRSMPEIHNDLQKRIDGFLQRVGNQ
ncbi:putative thymidylate kinase [Nitrosotalea devaniterrae]|uniref:Probable thymidylate kinase n=1 Tax=Nitrosotalea devaniterrae TaxID=1078905 RepID=A0A128A1P5_9ARCH|nr:putative thymidylate kinase [Candidatus Nitrosotalea devanaterra]